VVTSHRSTTDLLEEACSELAGLLDLVGETETRNGASAAGLRVVDDYLSDIDVQAGVRVRSTKASRLPGNQSVLFAVTEAHAAVREVERNLRYAITGHADTPRGSSDGNTSVALRNIVRLGATATDDDRVRAVKILHSATRQIQRLPAIDTLVEWKPIRLGPGGLPPQCEHCGTFSLRYAPVSGVVRCIYPADGQGCTDDDGHPTRGRLDLHRVTGTPVIAWRDGRVTYAPEHVEHVEPEHDDDEYEPNPEAEPEYVEPEYVEPEPDPMTVYAFSDLDQRIREALG
jgi:hypothetical protein